MGAKGDLALRAQVRKKRLDHVGHFTGAIEDHAKHVIESPEVGIVAKLLAVDRRVVSARGQIKFLQKELKETGEVKPKPFLGSERVNTKRNRYDPF